MTNEPSPDEGAAMLDALLATTSTRTLYRAQAAASGRAALEAAGVDIDALEERVARGGRPPVGGGPVIPGERSPRVNVAIPATVDELLNQRTAATGRSRSEVVRDALAAYLTAS